MGEIHEGVRQLQPRLSNWGRWGPDDELGTLNFITPERRRAAAHAVRRGDVFSLAIPLDKFGPSNNPFRPNPFHMMLATGVDTVQPFQMGAGTRYTDDAVFMPLQSSTQWDAIAHIYYEGYLYNGFPASEVDSRGAQKLGIDKTHDKYVGRGVLLDIARALQTDVLPGDFEITGDVLQQTADRQGVEICAGDMIVLRAGVMASWRRTGSWADFHRPRAGVIWSTAEWLFDHSIAAIAGDTVEKVDRIESGHLSSPFHMLVLRDMGMCIGELWFVEELADDCATDGVYEFLLVAPALRVTGGCGSPLNPIAMK